MRTSLREPEDQAQACETGQETGDVGLVPGEVFGLSNDSGYPRPGPSAGGLRAERTDARLLVRPFALPTRWRFGSQTGPAPSITSRKNDGRRSIMTQAPPLRDNTPRRELLLVTLLLAAAG